jgi:CHAT domain-containing protein/tetratricopeptide (TPR) repeat protein
MSYSLLMRNSFNVLLAFIMIGGALRIGVAVGIIARTQTQAQQIAEAQRLNADMERLARERRFAEAIPVAERLLSIIERLFGPDDVGVARLLNNLAGYYKETGNYAQAESSYLRSMAIVERKLGPTNAILAFPLSNLADLYRLMGDYAKAEQYYKRTLNVVDKGPGQKNADVAKALINLAGLYSEKGDYERAEPLLRRALTLSEGEGGAVAEQATALNDLAFLLALRADYTQAESLYKRALTVLESNHEAPQGLQAISLSGLARLYEVQGDFAQARPLYERALAVVERAVGTQNSSTATALNNLGLLYMEQGDAERAQPLFERALAIHERRYGPDSINLVSPLINLAWIYLNRGEISRGVQFLTRSFNIHERTLDLVLNTGSEKQKRLYLATLNSETDGLISQSVQGAPNDVELTALTMTTILRRKGRALDAMSEQIGMLRRRMDARNGALLDELAEVRGKRASLMFKGSAQADETNRAYIATLEARIEELERRVAEYSAEFRDRLQPVTLERVQASIPTGAALVEFVSYRPFNMKASVSAQKPAAPRYVAYVLRREGNPVWVELGDSATIDGYISQLRAAFRNSKSVDAKALARMLDEKLMRPIRKLLGDSRQVLLSPDGVLNLLPFGALVDEQNHYLIEGYSISYLTSGRDLLRTRLADGNSQNAPVILANPLFDNASTPNASEPVESQNVEGGSRSIDFTKFKYPPLPGTLLEAREIAALLTDAEVFTDAKATESAIKRVSRPTILHVATHGFFLEDQKQGVGDARSLVRERAESTDVPFENPLLRSGLILAGVTQRSSGPGEDGVLSALETAGLDLRGTKLVVLSACETGIGDVKVGDGVFGLRRALVLAGAESQVTTLWQVDDKATRDLMVDFYKRLQKGEGRGEALRNAQLSMMKSVGRSHPYFWASFIQIGDWRPVNPEATSGQGKENLIAQKAKSAMTNADVIQMVGAALSERVIITSIRQVPAKDFDLTPNGLIALRKTGVSDAVISVMQEVSVSPTSTSAERVDPPRPDEGSTATLSSDNSPVPKTTTATGARNLEALSASFDRGEEVVFKVRYYSSGNLLTGSPGMRDGLVTVSKTAVAFQPTVDAKGFSVSPDKILEVINEQPLRVRLKVVIKNAKGDKEDKKDFQFFHPSAFVDGFRFYCNGCDASMKVLFAFLQHVRGKL